MEDSPGRILPLHCSPAPHYPSLPTSSLLGPGRGCTKNEKKHRAARSRPGDRGRLCPLLVPSPSGVVSDGVEPVGRRVGRGGQLKPGFPTPLQRPHLQPACLFRTRLLPPQAKANREYPTLLRISPWLSQPEGKGSSDAKSPQKRYCGAARAWERSVEGKSSVRI